MGAIPRHERAVRPLCAGPSLAVALLFIIVVFGAIVFLVYRDRSPGPSYFASSTQARRQLPINGRFGDEPAAESPYVSA